MFKQSLRISSVEKEGVYQASKWLKLPMLIDGPEMQSFIDCLEEHWIFPMSGLVDGSPISSSFFVSEYTRWIEGLKRGVLPRDEELRRLFAAGVTDDLDSFWLQPIASKEGQYLIKPSAPVVQLQTHYVHYSSVDGEFRSMSIGKESIFWGMQCSFPQVVQDPKTMEIAEVKQSALFRKMREWVKENTRPTPFVVDGVKKNVPIRLGKNCFSWIGHHPDLRMRGLKVYGCV